MAPKGSGKMQLGPSSGLSEYTGCQPGSGEGRGSSVMGYQFYQPSREQSLKGCFWDVTGQLHAVTFRKGSRTSMEGPFWYEGTSAFRKGLLPRIQSCLVTQGQRTRVMMSTSRKRLSS